jgi:hypothetical protein
MCNSKCCALLRRKLIYEKKTSDWSLIRDVREGTAAVELLPF